MICPQLRSQEVMSAFNKIIERLGGKPMDQTHVLDREAYKQGLSDEEKNAYSKAYALWNEHGHPDKVNEYLDRAEAIKKKLIEQYIPKETKPVYAEKPKEPKSEPKVQPKTETSQLAERVEAEAIKKKLVDRFEGLPEYQTMNMEEQAKMSADLINSDYPKALRVAMGQENPPKDLREASVFEAVKMKALKDGDVETLRSLATQSTVPSKLTAYGQEIKAADVKNPEDPVSAMQEVKKEREKKFERLNKNRPIEKAKKETVEQIRKEIKKKTVRSKETWEMFVNRIKC
jgi:hypothetical protein